MLDLAYARSQDAADPLAALRQQFHMPTDGEGNHLIYLCGNSLGLQPKKAQTYLLEELEDWQKFAVEGHTQARRPWLSYHEQFAEPLARLVGAMPHEVVVMNGLTANLHFLMASFYRPTAQRYKIIIEKGAFPSDQYAVASQARFHGFGADAIVEIAPRTGEDYLRLEDIEATISREAQQTALILLSGVNYYTGQVFEMQHITAFAKKLGIVVGWDLAHAVGNVQLDLHGWGVDFAAWCHYKYLNSGPGATAGAFVHEAHLDNPNIPRFEGWWGHDKSSRFRMPDRFVPMPTAEAWQLSNAPVLSMAPLIASLELFEQAGIANLRQKSLKLTGFLLDLLRELGDKVRIITPTDERQRGCQLSLSIGERGKPVHEALSLAGVITDWREPNVIRVAPAPLYNSFEDVFEFVQRLKSCINN